MAPPNDITPPSLKSTVGVFYNILFSGSKVILSSWKLTLDGFLFGTCAPFLSSYCLSMMSKVFSFAACVSDIRLSITYFGYVTNQNGLIRD